MGKTHNFAEVESLISNSITSKLSTMFKPKSVALVGASTDPKKLGAIVLRNLIDSNYSGEIFPLNLKSDQVNGLKAYKNYQDLPSIPELALIAIPAASVAEALETIAIAGTKNVVIFSAGFKETGQEGSELEDQLKRLVEKYKINLLGPNCLGFVNNLTPINATFGQLVNKKGNLRFLSQSGAIASSVFDWAEYNDIGFSEFITLGNKTDLNENDILEYFLENDIHSITKEDGDSAHVPIGMYLESIIDGKKFIEVAQKISRQDPLFILKPGKSAESKQAMQSHTGSIAGEDYVFDAALEKAGVLRCEGIEDFFDLARVFAWEKIPAGKNIAIVSNAGGPAVLSSDFVVSEGLNLMRFEGKTKEKLESLLPRAASIVNPVDVLGDALAERYESAIKTLIVDESVHSLLIILTPQVMTQIDETAEVIGRLSLEYDKPIFCSFMGGSHISTGEKVLNKYKIPSFRYPERAVRAIAKMNKWNQFRLNLKNQSELASDQDNNSANNSKTAQIISSVLEEGRKTLNSFEVNDIFTEYGIKMPATMSCRTVDDAINFSKTNNYPLVLKISSPMLLHKSDEGGVIVGIKNLETLKDSYAKMEAKLNKIGDNKSSSIQVQQQVDEGIELIVGSKKDITFGNVIMFGAGGVLANLIQDRNLGLMPLSKNELIDLIRKSKVNKLLEGYRGSEVYDISSIVDLFEKLQKLLGSNKGILELDINPAIINKSGLWTVDGKIVLK